MKIHVSQVPAEGLSEHASYDPTELDMERNDVHLPEPFEVDAVVTKAAEELIVSVDIRCSIQMSCARCLEEFSETLAKDAVFNYRVKPVEVVDITDDIRQEIMLAYPVTPLCSADCKGLCVACGQNLNEGACGHSASHAAEE